MKKSTSVLSIFFYALAIIFLMFACFYFVTTYQTVALVLDSGQSTVGMSDIIGLYISQVAPYVAYSSLLYGVGYIISKFSQVYGLFTKKYEDILDDMVEKELNNAEAEEYGENEEI